MAISHLATLSDGGDRIDFECRFGTKARQSLPDEHRADSTSVSVPPLALDHLQICLVEMERKKNILQFSSLLFRTSQLPLVTFQGVKLHQTR